MMAQLGAGNHQTDILNCPARRFPQAYRPIAGRFLLDTNGMMSLRVAAVAAALTPLVSLIAAPEATATGSVVDYSVHSDGPISSITFHDAAHKVQQILNVAAPWGLTFVSQDSYPYYSLAAQTTTGTFVSCQITVNGQVVSQAGGEGPHSVAGCFWQAPG